WIDWQALSYFQFNQSVGVVFSQANAAEVMRRANLVAPFELQRFARSAVGSTDNQRLVVGRIFHGDGTHASVSPTDLRRLCADPSLDIAFISGPPLSGH